jgi:3-hydroxyacyl-CoA dehydrogenase
VLVRWSGIEAVGITGAGIMGSQIAQVLAAAGHAVRLQDIQPDALSKALHGIEHDRFGLRAAVNRGKLTAAEADAALARIRTTTDLEEACRDVDLVIEAVPELIDLKMEVFRKLDAITRPDTILASNTAGLSITALAHATARPGLVLGWHWSAPCAVMRMAEIIIHPATEQCAIDAVVAAAARCGKNPQVIKDQPLVWGFVANRIMLQVRREALRIVREGIATPEQVDALMKDCFRWPTGPFEQMGNADQPMGSRPEAELLR